MTEQTTAKPAVPLAAEAGAEAGRMIESAGAAAEKARDDLAERIEAARQRSLELAESASTRAREFVQEHPVATVAGGIVIGALIAGALGAHRRRNAAAAEAIETTAARLGRLATVGAEIALAYAARAADAGKDGATRLNETLAPHLSALSDSVAETGAEAGKRASELADAALAATREAGETLVNRLFEKIGRK